jgi:hypothetical protein
MTIEVLQTAIERIGSDPELARRIYEDAAVIEELELDLDQDEIEAVHQALAVDIQNCLGEVTAFSELDWASITFPQLEALPAEKRAGKVQLPRLNMTHYIDKASPQ